MTTTDKPDVRIWKVADLIPYAKNAKKHPPDQVKALAAQIELRGWTQPIIIDETGNIIGGHGRRLAAIELGRTTVPVIVMTGLSADEIDAMRLADNRVASNEYDAVLIQEEIARLYEKGVDMELTAYNPKELDFLTTDLSQFDDSVFVDDLNEAVEEQKNNNAAEQEKVDVTSAPIADALGFKRLTIAQSRRVRAWMLGVESDTGEKGVDALMKFLDQAGVA